MVYNILITHKEVLNMIEINYDATTLMKNGFPDIKRLGL